jgi:hypothetical protein
MDRHRFLGVLILIASFAANASAGIIFKRTPPPPAEQRVG